MEDLESAFANALTFAVISLVQFVVERLIVMPSLGESFISYFYFELTDFYGWVPNLKKLRDVSCRYISFDDQIKIKLWMISDLTNFYIEVPHKFTPDSLDVLANEIGSKFEREESPI